LPKADRLLPLRDAVVIVGIEKKKNRYLIRWFGQKGNSFGLSAIKGKKRRFSKSKSGLKGQNLSARGNAMDKNKNE